MSSDRLLGISDRWFRLVQRLYPRDFRAEMGTPVAEAYRDRAREAIARGGVVRLAALWLRALVDSLRNGLGERLRRAPLGRLTGNWRRDAALAGRRLLRAPTLVLAIVATLTVGLGLFAVVYTVVVKILIAPLPYRAPDDLYFVWRDYRAYFDLDRGWLGGTDVAELQKAGGPIEGAAGLLRQLATFAAREGDEPSEIAVMIASPNLFDLLGVQPAIGRNFLPTEVGPGRPPVIVLTHALWNRLGGDGALLGATVRLNGQPYTVIGVLPENFSFVRNASLGSPQRADAYTTLPVHLAETNPNGGSYAGLIRARPGSSPEVVAAAVAAVGRAVDARDFKGRGLKLYPVGLKTDLVSPVRPALIVLGFAGLLLVLVLLVNLSSVLIARAAQRDHEFAVSRALGADRGALVRGLVLEGGLLGLVSGVAAALAAIWGTRTLVALAPLDLPRRDAIALDWNVALVIVGTGALVGVLAAIAPAVLASRAALSSVLARSAVRGGGGGHGRMRRVMVVAQVTCTLVLLNTGGLVVRSLDRLLRADPGFTASGIVTMRIPMPTQIVPKVEEALLLQERIEEALAAIAGVSGASATSSLPLTASASQTTIRIPGAPGNTGDADRDAPLVDYLGVRADYVTVMGMRVVAGRALDRARRPDVREALIDRQLAQQFFPNSSPLGAKIPFDNDLPLTVVGVVDQARLYDVHQDGRPQLYIRAEDWNYRTLTFVLRAAGDPASIVPAARAAIRQIDPRLALANVQTMDEVIDDALRRQRMSTALISGFALGALLLAAVGLFGVISGSVARRRHELALRLAVGADHGRLLRLILREGARLVGIGVLIGAPGIYVAGRLARGTLVGISPFDPLTLAVVGAGLGAVTLLACYLPARRVLRIDPAQSLRQV